MSWFDSSFSLAKNAFSQAQKSIDKVLDIKEREAGQESVEDPHVLPSPVETSNTKSPVSLSETKSFANHHTPHRTDEHNATPPPTFDSTWGQSDSVWGTPFTSPPSTTKGSGSKDSRLSSSKVTLQASSKGSSNVKTTPTSQRTKPKGSKSHATSTPIGTGGGVGEGDVQGLTPVKPIDEEGLTPVKPIDEEGLTPIGEGLLPSTDKSTDSNIIIASDDGNDKNEHSIYPSDKDTGLIVLSTTSKETSAVPLLVSKSLDDDTQLDISKHTVTALSTHDSRPSTQSDSIGGSGEVADEETKEETTASVNENVPTCIDAAVPVKYTLNNVSKDNDKVEADTYTTEAVTRSDGLHAKLSTPKEVADPHQSRDAIGTVSEGDTKAETATLTDDDASNEVLQTLKKESARLSELLEAREGKMMDMSRQLVAFTEENHTLQSQLAEAKEVGLTDIDELRAEFTQRIGASDKKLQAVSKERDSLRKQLQALQNEQSQQKKSQSDSLTTLLQEKEEQIAQLMEEGEKLSKQELQSNSIIKKLRQKERQNDQLLSSQKQHIEDVESKVSNLKEQCKKRDEKERKYQESLGQLNIIAEQQAKELTALKTERDALTDKVRSLQTNLDNAYKELSDLQKENAVSQTAAQEAAISAQSSARVEVMGLLETQKAETQREKEGLLLQLDELRMSITRAEQLSARKEDHLRQEISDLQERLQEAETRNQELTSTISQATKPLLRQIENIQAAHSNQTANWERVESNLTQRLVALQAQLSQSSEKERTAVEKEMTLQSRVTILETQASSLRQEKSQLLASEELVKAKLQTIEEEQHRESAKMEGLRASFQQTMEDLRKEKEMLERQLEYERVRLEAESKKARLEAQEKERLRSQLANFSSLNRPPTVARQSSSGSVHSQSELLEHSLRHISESSISAGVEMTDYHSNSLKGGSASLTEHLQSLLKQKEGELSTAQTLVGTLERSRSALAEDLSSLSAENDTLKTQVELIVPLRDSLQIVEQKHEAMLQMYGEKAEEAEELKLDILDVKAMYRQQIDELLGGKR